MSEYSHRNSDSCCTFCKERSDQRKPRSSRRKKAWSYGAVACAAHASWIIFHFIFYLVESRPQPINRRGLSKREETTDRAGSGDKTVDKRADTSTILIDHDSIISQAVKGMRNQSKHLPSVAQKQLDEVCCEYKFELAHQLLPLSVRYSQRLFGLN
jgi:hypothetical protein